MSVYLREIHKRGHVLDKRSVFHCHGTWWDFEHKRGTLLTLDLWFISFDKTTELSHKAFKAIFKPKRKLALNYLWRRWSFYIHTNSPKSHKFCVLFSIKRSIRLNPISAHEWSPALMFVLEARSMAPHVGPSVIISPSIHTRCFSSCFLANHNTVEGLMLSTKL